MAKHFIKVAYLKEIDNSLQICKDELKNLLQNISHATENREVGIVAVFAPQTPSCRDVLTDWLIHWFENSFKVESETTEIGGPGKLEFFDPRNMRDGVYVWNQLYKVSSHRGTLPPIYITLYICGNQPEIQEMALSICSQAFTLGKKEKEKLIHMQHRIQNLKGGSLAEIVCVPIPKFEYTSKLEKNKVGKNFMDVVESHPIPIKRILCAGSPELQELRLSTFLPFLQTIVNMLNECRSEEPENETLLDSGTPKQTFSGDRLTCNVNAERVKSKLSTAQEEANRSNLQSTEERSRNLRSEKDDKNLTDDSKIPTQDSQVRLHKSSPCNNACQQLQRDIEIRMTQWLKHQTGIYDPKLMVNVSPKMRADDFHNLVTEIEEISELLEVFISDLTNMFDNHVCFYGIEDEKLFAHLTNTAFIRALNSLKERNFSHEAFLKSLLKKACTCILGTFKQDNLLIIKKELKIAAEVKSSAKAAFQNSLSVLSTTIASIENLEMLRQRIQHSLVNLMARCMEYGARLNQGQTEASNEMVTDMNEIFTDLMTELHELKLKEKSPYNHAIYLYQKQMQKIYNNPTKFRQADIFKHHTDNVKKVVSTLATETEKDEVISALQGHLSQLMLIRLEKIQIDKIRSTQLNTVCIYLAPNWIKVDIMLSIGHYTVVHGTDRVDSCPNVLVLTQAGQVLVGFKASEFISKNLGFKHHGNTYTYISSITNNEKTACYMLKGLFEHLKLEAERVFEKDLPRAMILVPSWHQVEHLLGIQGCALSQFLEAYVLKEGSLIARQVLEEAEQKQANSYSSLAISITISKTEIIIEIYGKCFSNMAVVKLLAHSVAFLPNTELESNSGEALSGAHLTKSKEIRKDELLLRCYSNAMARIIAARKSGRKYCFLLAENDDWLTVFHNVFTNEQNLVLIKNPREKYGVTAAVNLSVDPRIVRDVIIDYVCLDNGDNNVTSTPAETCLDDVDPLACTSERENLNEELRERKQNLMKKCKNIRVQMESGQVRVRRLFQKDVNETLERAEEVASENVTNLNDVKDQEIEIDELIAEHNFFEEDGSTKL